nr:CDP-glycerol glycerophosphotransferase family protein [Larsenimonas suaedae]
MSIRDSITIVSAVYNVEEYLEEFLSSIIRQKVNINNNLSVILVDDGSTDRSLEICNEWREKYPRIFEVISKSNGGPASARNAGLEKVSSKWVTFCDSDDILGWDYLLEFNCFLTRCESLNVFPDLISCRLLVYWEETGKYDYSHPLDFKFKGGSKVFDINEGHDLGLQLSASHAFYNMDVINNNNLRFLDVKPSFEDALFASMFILKSNETMGVVKEAHYFYRKRRNQSSLMGNVWSKEEKYKEQIEFGNMRLINEALEIKGYIPKWVSNVLIYDALWNFGKFVNKGLLELSGFSDDLLVFYRESLRSMLKEIPLEHIINANVPHFSEVFKYYFLSFIGAYNELKENVFAEAFDYDESARLLGIKIRAVENLADRLSFYSSSIQIFPEFKKIKVIDFLEEVLAYEVVVWLPLNESPFLQICLDDEFLEFKGSRKLNRFVSKYIDKSHLAKNKAPSRTNELSKKVHRSFYDTGFLSKRFKDSWLFIDRGSSADDNAEHLYRYVIKKHQGVNAYYVLSKGSQDWGRLKKEGFNLIEYNSFEHKQLLLSCIYLISSHADEYIFNVMRPVFYKDIIKYKFIFLQHGVIQNDLSFWLNNKDIDLFLTASVDEFESIGGDFNRYKFSKKEVVLTGLPRHDSLSVKQEHKERSEVKRVVIMPTWRKSLVGAIKPLSNNASVNPIFFESFFYKDWVSLLKCLSNMECVKSGLVQIDFCPHSNLQAYSSFFRLDGVNIVSPKDFGSIQDLFVRSDMIITDYSSVAFEMGFLEKPVVYYQTGRDSIYSGGHTTSLGYFDYSVHGLGPVFSEPQEVKLHIEKEQMNGFVMPEKYRCRAKEMFPYEKGKACERVYEEILKLG